MYQFAQTHQDVRTGGHVVYDPVEVACEGSKVLVYGQNGVQESEPDDNEGISPQFTSRAFGGCVLEPCRKKSNLMQPCKVRCVHYYQYLHCEAAKEPFEKSTRGLTEETYTVNKPVMATIMYDERANNTGGTAVKIDQTHESELTSAIFIGKN